MRLVHAGILCAALVSAGCGAATTEADDGTCHQTYEFGNYGCGDVRGRVLDAAGQPIPGAYAVVASQPTAATAHSGDLFSSYARADSVGRYSVHITYMQPVTATTGTLAWALVTVPYCNALIIKDSVQITAPKAVVGQPAPLLELPDFRLTLPTLAQRQAACG